EQCQERGVSSSEAKPITAEPTATPTPKGRKKQLLSPDEFAEKKQAALIKEEIEARRKEHGYEPCEDSIWRPESDRIEAGFIVKSTDGVWRKLKQATGE